MVPLRISWWVRVCEGEVKMYLYASSCNMVEALCDLH
jgi:hypothetical protein